jgi:hypothetical protein
MEGIWNAIKTHKWIAIGGAAVLGGILLYAYLHRNSSSTSTAGTQDLLATSGGGPTYSLGTTDGSGGGGGGTGTPTGIGVSPVSPASPVAPVLPYVAGTSAGSDTPAYSVPAASSAPSTIFAPPATIPAALPVTPVKTPATPAPIPVGLTGVNYEPTPNTPNQITVGSASGLTAIALPVGETMSTPVTVPNISAGNPVVPISSLISTGSTNTLSSAYGNAQTAAVATQTLNPGQTPTGTAVYLGANPTIVSGQSSPGVNAPIGQIPGGGSSGSPLTPVGSVGNPSAAQIAATVKGSTPAVKASLASATKAAAGITY